MAQSMGMICAYGSNRCGTYIYAISFELRDFTLMSLYAPWSVVGEEKDLCETGLILQTYSLVDTMGAGVY